MKTSPDPSVTTAASPLRLLSGWRAKFVLLTLVWGMSFVLIRIGAEVLTPVQLSLGRMLLGAVPVVAVTAGASSWARPRPGTSRWARW